jgi:hypothetical protein
MKRNKFLQGPILPIAAVALLAMSVVGSTRAAITETSNNFKAELQTAALSVALYEQTGNESEARQIADQTAAASDEGAGETAASAVGTLKIVSEADAADFKIGKEYAEKLSVVNDGEYDEYVRVIVTKSWQDENGKKDTLLDPDLIELGLVNKEDWIAVSYDNKALGSDRSNNEQTVYYYRYPLKAKNSQSTGETVVSNEVTLINSVTVNNKVTTQVTATPSADEKLTGTITNVYDYNGKSFSINVEVDAVQTHSAADAIYGAWGVKAVIDDATGELTSITDPTEKTESSENGSENGSENESENGSDEGGAGNE